MYIGVKDTFKTRSNRKRTISARVVSMQRKYKLPKGVAESLLREESL